MGQKSENILTHMTITLFTKLLIVIMEINSKSNTEINDNEN